MTLSSADNPLQTVLQTLVPDPIRGQTVLHFKGYEKLKLNQYLLTLRKTLLMPLASADNPLQTIWTQIRPDIQSGPYQGPDCLAL